MPHRPIQSHRFDRWMLAVAALAVLVRLVYIAEGARDPSFAHPVIDSSTYDQVARTIAQGVDPWRGAFSRPPLYPYLLAAVYFLVGPSLTAARVLQALLAGGTCVLTCLLGGRVFNRRVGLAGGTVVALYGPMVFFDERILASGVVVFCFTLGLLLAVRAFQQPIWFNWLLAGVGLGVAALARPNILVFLPLVAIAALISPARRRHWGRPVAHLACLLAGSAAIVSPITLRNYLAGGEFVPIAVIGGMNLYLGNNPEAERTLAVRPGPDWERLARMPHANGMVSLKATEDYFLGLVGDYARTQPGHFCAGLARKARLFCSSIEVPRNYDPYFHRRYSSLLAVLTWRAGSFGFPLGVVGPLAVLGMLVAWRSRPGAWLLICYALACAVSVILFFNASRYRLPIVSVLALFAAWSLVWAWGQVAAGRYLQTATAATGLAVIALFVNLPVPTPYDDINFEADLCDGVACRMILEGDLAGAERNYRRALELTPDSAELHNSLSYVLQKLGRPGEALRHARIAVDLEPDLPDARLTLGQVLADLGALDEAAQQLRLAIAADPGDPRAAGALAVVLARQEQYAAAMEQLHRAIHLRNDEPQYHVQLARVLVKQRLYGEAADALARAREHTDSAEVIDELAWLLATCPDDSVRDPQRALALTDPTTRDRLQGNAAYLDTRAAALAAAGWFEEAIEVATQARQLARQAGQYEQAAAINARRSAYLDRQPCRDPNR